MNRDRVRGRWPAIALGCMVCSSLVGCVERRYTIRTDPPGALVYVNGEELGPSPASHSFTYYGDREIVLVADGYETERIIQPIKAPLYDNNLTDVFTENFLPFTLRDEREFTYKLRPSTVPETGDLVNRADQLRAQGKQPPPPRRRGLFGFLGF